jgi:hypothetical protein
MADEPIVQIDFAEGGNSASFVTSGWAPPERHGTWSDGPESFLVVPGLVPGRTYRVSLSAGPFLVPPAVQHQDLFIFANGVEVFGDRLTQGRAIAFVIPPQALNASRKVEFRFYCPTAVSPMSIGHSVDVRRLWCSVWRLTITAEGEATRTFGGGHHDVTLGPPQKVAAVTMVYNEPEYLPVWLRHSAAQVGIENCYVIDHGSDDGSTTGLACNVVRIPRSPYDPAKQSKFNSEFCSSLLNWFDWVLYSDVDEVVMADPQIAPNLREYCRRPLPDVVTAIGLNSAHRPQSEPPLDFARSITEQRQYVFTASSMCKPLLIRKPVTWSPGSHSSDAELVFDHLYLFHLRWVDLPYGLRRLQKTRAMAWARTDGGVHQRVDDQKMTDIFMGFANLPPLDGIDFDPALAPVRDFLDAVVASQAGRENETYKIALNIWAGNLWKMPDRFIGTF